MRPLVQAIQDEKKSLVIAPEGTRAPTPKLGAFKKGGFHVAVQSGVPIVPVVIHNSGDISPKGDKIFRSGTVHVDVLPAIETADWSVANIDGHVAEVRNAFLRTLGQPELSAEETAKARRNTPDDLKPEVRGQRRKVALKQSASESKEQGIVSSKNGTKQSATLDGAQSASLQSGFDQETSATRH
jgi:putative phosphoserine phosphatase/1-acylglycerol-3-phosphate O-acyltransferase